MAEMEKEGRPPENKRSRKPAHPVKREINEEMKVGAVMGRERGPPRPPRRRRAWKWNKKGSSVIFFFFVGCTECVSTPPPGLKTETNSQAANPVH